MSWPLDPERSLASPERAVLFADVFTNYGSPERGLASLAVLRAVGIDVTHDLPGVGKNFQDHMDVYLTAETTPVSYNASDRPDKALAAGLEYVLFRGDQQSYDGLLCQWSFRGRRELRIDSLVFIWSFAWKGNLSRQFIQR